MPTQAAATTTARPGIATIELRGRLTDPTLTIVDVRPIAAYNGWRLENEIRGGHIAGAVAFPSPWLDDVDQAVIEKQLRSKGITAGRDVVVYGDGLEAAAFAAKLNALGIEDAIVYEDGFATWAADETLPLDRLPRYDRLVHVGWLRHVLDGERPEAAPAGKAILLHVNFGLPEEYADGHLPGALYLDTNWLEDPADWNRRSPEALDAALRSLGITHDTTVIAYGRDTERDANEMWPGRRAGQLAAARALMILWYAGVDDVRLLDGGYHGWVQAGYDLETIPREPTPVASFGVQVPLRPEVIVDIDGAKEILADPRGAALVSVRTWREHIGAASGYPYIGPAGRIAGDVWASYGADSDQMQPYRSVDNTMRPYPEIAAHWERAGITPDKWVAFYCGTGWRASETWFCAYLQAWERIAVYDGGWFEWSRDPISNPIEIGEPHAGAAPLDRPSSGGVP